MSQQILTQARLKSLLDYDPETGVFTRKRSTTVRGQQMGGLSPKGYHRIGVDRKRYLTHRLVWLYVYGAWPKGEVDHINRNNSDNRLANLRDVSPSENQHNRGTPINNSSGYAGVSWDSHNLKWSAAISAKRKHYSLGRFDSRELAAAAYQAAKLIHHPTAPTQ